MSINSIIDDPQELVRCAVVLMRSKAHDKAIALAKQAIQGAPHNPEIQAAARAILSWRLDAYHRPMLADAPRNSAYRMMIERNVKGKRVLDIGTGTGLLAMMAARAGAEHVYACEVEPATADIARDIVAQNGLSDRITIIDANSMTLDRERLGGGVDAVLSEIFSDDVVGEGVVEALEHAQRELCAPGAIFLPPKVSIMGALAYQDSHTWISEIEGFDLSLLEQRLTHAELIAPCKAERHQSSDARELCLLDFAPDTPIRLGDRTITSLVSRGGTVNGVMYWLKIDFGEGVHYENAPGGSPLAHWLVRFEPFGEPRDTVEGDVIKIGLTYQASEVVIWEAG